jgi:putative DNA primase/helicase
MSASKAYGAPLSAFLEAVAEDPTAWTEWIKQVRRGFEAELKLPGADGQVRRAIGRFSLIAAAGELATKLGITGWPEGEASGAILRCFEAWLDHRGSTGPAELQAGVQQVRRFIEQHGESRFSPWDEDASRPTINRVGFRKRADDGVEFFVLPESFRAELCAGFDAGSLARELVRVGLLLPAPDGRPQRSERLPGYEGTKRVYRLTPKIIEG